MSLEISPEVEHVLRERAAAEGISINDLLARTFASAKPDKPSTKDPGEHVRALLAEWQVQDNTPTLPSIPTQEGETPTEALFRAWEEEDARMTDAEVQAEERLWEEFQESINAERRQAGMRTLF